MKKLVSAVALTLVLSFTIEGNVRAQDFDNTKLRAKSFDFLENAETANYLVSSGSETSLLLSPRIGTEVVIPRGQWRAPDGVKFKGQTYLLIPADLRNSKGRELGVPTRRPCGKVWIPYVAVNATTGMINQYAVWDTTPCAGELDRVLVWDRFHTIISGGLALRHLSDAEARSMEIDEYFERNAQRNAQEQLRIEQARVAEQRRADEENWRLQRIISERPEKIKIGATICKTSGRSYFRGFTEGYSDQTEKIKIRIVSARYISSSQWDPSYRPEIIWENPDIWSICE